MSLENRTEKQDKIVIASNKKIDYNSKSFQNGIKKMYKEIERLKELSKPDYERMRITFDI